MIGIDQMFLVSEILDKTGFDLPEMTKKIDGNTVEKSEKEVAKEIGINLIKKMYMAKEQIIKLVEISTDKSVEELTSNEFLNTFVDALRNNGILSFGKSSGK